MYFVKSAAAVDGAWGSSGFAASFFVGSDIVSGKSGWVLKEMEIKGKWGVAGREGEGMQGIGAGANWRTWSRSI